MENGLFDHNEYRIKGSRIIDIKDGIYNKYWNGTEWIYRTLQDTWIANINANLWTSYPDGDPWRIHAYNSVKDSDPDYRINVSISPNIQYGFSGGVAENGVISVPKGTINYSLFFVNMTITCISNMLYYGSQGYGSSFICDIKAEGGVTGGFTSCIIIGDIELNYLGENLNSISFNNCVLTENTLDPFQTSNNLSQLGWTAPAWPDWDADLTEYENNTLTDTVETPPQPGTLPYETGFPYAPYPDNYGFGYLSTPRIGIGALYFVSQVSTSSSSLSYSSHSKSSHSSLSHSSISKSSRSRSSYSSPSSRSSRSSKSSHSSHSSQSSWSWHVTPGTSPIFKTTGWTRRVFHQGSQEITNDPKGILKVFLDIVNAQAITGTDY
jgi:hypothetical protein